MNPPALTFTPRPSLTSPYSAKPARDLYALAGGYDCTLDPYADDNEPSEPEHASTHTPRSLPKWARVTLETLVCVLAGAAIVAPFAWAMTH